MITENEVRLKASEWRAKADAMKSPVNGAILRQPRQQFADTVRLVNTYEAKASALEDLLS